MPDDGFRNFDLILDDLEAVDKPTAVKVQHELIAPQPGGQVDFLSRIETEVLFGGAAGGGKSYALVLDALGIQYAHDEFGVAAYEHPKYRAVLFRRTSTRLQNLIDLAREIYEPFGVKFVLQRKGEPGSSFTFPSGAKIFLCHLEKPSDVDSHHGGQYQYIGFDELTQFTIYQYLFLFSRLRGVVINNGVSIGKRMRSTTNPIGEGLVWVRKRFIKNTAHVLVPGRTYFFIADPDAEKPEDNPMGIMVGPEHSDFGIAKSRTFIPGFLFENKSLMDADPGYAANIMQLGSKMEKALVDGDWDAFGGDFFDSFDSKGAKEKPFDIPDHWPLYGSLDPGWASPCAFSLVARDPHKHIHVLFTYYVRNVGPDQHASAIYKLIKNFPYTKGRMPDLIVSGLDAFAKKEKLAINATDMTFSDIFNSHGLYLQRAKTDRVIGWWTLKQYFSSKMFHYFDGFNGSLIDELNAAPTDENNVEDIKGGGNDPSIMDHAIDEIRYNVMAIPYPFTKNQVFRPYQFDNYGKKKRRNKDNLTVMSK